MSEKDVKYNQGFYDGYKQATEQANACIGQVRNDIWSELDCSETMEINGKHYMRICKVIDIIDKYTKGADKCTPLA